MLKHIHQALSKTATHFGFTVAMTGEFGTGGVWVSSPGFANPRQVQPDTLFYAQTFSDMLSAAKWVLNSPFPPFECRALGQGELPYQMDAWTTEDLVLCGIYPKSDGLTVSPSGTVANTALQVVWPTVEEKIRSIFSYTDAETILAALPEVSAKKTDESLRLTPATRATILTTYFVLQEVVHNGMWHKHHSRTGTRVGSGWFQVVLSTAIKRNKSRGLVMTRRGKHWNYSHILAGRTTATPEEFIDAALYDEVVNGTPVSRFFD